jgi:hypothetical protein
MVEFKYFGSSVFIRPMFSRVWLTVKSKFFGSSMFGRSPALPWTWLTTKFKLFKSSMFVRFVLFWIWLTVKSKCFRFNIFNRLMLSWTWLIIKFKIFGFNIFVKPRLSLAWHVYHMHFILTKYFNPSSTENVRYLIWSASLYFFCCLSLANHFWMVPNSLWLLLKPKN